MCLLKAHPIRIKNLNLIFWAFRLARPKLRVIDWTIWTSTTFVELVITFRNLVGRLGFASSTILDSSNSSAMRSAFLFAKSWYFALFSSMMALSKASLVHWISLVSSRMYQQWAVGEVLVMLVRQHYR